MNDYLRSLLLAGLFGKGPLHPLCLDNEDVTYVTVQGVADLVELVQRDRIGHLIVKLIDRGRADAGFLCKPRLCPAPFAEAHRKKNTDHAGTLLLRSILPQFCQI